jgi:pilus assembly protein CpaF
MTMSNLTLSPMSPTSPTAQQTARSVDVRHPKYQEIKGKVHQDLLKRLNLERLTRVRREDAEPEIRGLIVGMLETESQATPLSLFEREALISDVLNELFGLGPLEAFLRDPAISDILVNRYNRIYVEREGKIEESDAVFKDDKHLLQIIERIVSSVGRRIDESSPMVDARLADGSRVNAIIPPLALDGPALSIRRFRTDRLAAQDLVDRTSLTQPMLDFLKATVGARLNVVVSGGTGAGKTTLLNILSSFISDRERVITIEDAAELMLRQRHVVRLETRPANIEGKGAVRQRELVINALRMRPDRIVVGEVRGEEALDMLQAMNTGHDGSLTTIHANSPRDALYRLDTMVAMANLNVPDKAIRQQVASAVNVIVQISRLSDGTRKVTAVSEITGMEGDVITMQDLFVFERTGVTPEGRVSGKFRATGIRPKVSDKIASAGFTLPTTMFEHVKQVA